MTAPYAPIEPESAPEVEDRSLLRLVLGIVAAVLLVVGVVAVLGGDDDDVKIENPAALLSAAPDAVRDAGSAKIAMSMEVSGGGVNFGFSGSGVTEFATNKGDFTLKVLGQEVEILTDGTTMYFRGGGMTGATKPWVSLPFSQFQSQNTMASVDSATGFLAGLRGIGADDIEQRETDEVNGVKATHFHTTISIAEAIANAPEAQRAQVQQSLEQLEGFGAQEIPVDVWVTSDGLPVRQIFSFEGKPPGGGIMPDVSVEVRVDLTDFGEPVTIEVPPADQVQPLTDATQLGQLFGGTETPAA